MGTASPMEIIGTKSLRTPFLIILVVHIGQQANGINCILFYAASIFEQERSFKKTVSEHYSQHSNYETFTEKSENGSY